MYVNTNLRKQMQFQSLLYKMKYNIIQTNEMYSRSFVIYYNHNHLFKINIVY